MFQSPTFTQIPNIIFDELLPKMKEAEFRIFMIICRHTIGWHVREKMFSLSFFQEMTGMSKQGVLNGIQTLEEKKLIIKKKVTLEKGFTYSYSINIDYSKEKITDVNEVDYPGPPSRLPPSQLSGPDPVNEVDTYKERRINKTNPLPPPLGVAPKRGNASEPMPAFENSIKKFTGIKEEDLGQWKIAYPGINIDQELRKMEDWLTSNPSKRPKSNIRAFISRWLTRAQNNLALQASKPSQPVYPQKQAFKPKIAETTIYDNLF